MYNIINGDREGRHNIGSTVYIHAAGVGNKEETKCWRHIDLILLNFFCWFSIIDIEHVNRKEENRHEERQINQTSFMYGGVVEGGLFASLHFIEFFSK